MKITCISDTHDKHDELILPGGDLLLHAGDATMTGTKNQLTNFVLWLAKQPYTHKVWVAGNHDWGMEYDQMAYEAWCGRRMREVKQLVGTRNFILELCKHHNIHYLNNESVQIEGLNIFGSPDQPAFCGWAFNRSHKFLEDHWKIVPDDTNILITHCPAYGILDSLNNGDMVGDVALMKRINTLPNLKMHVCGHIHESRGILDVGPVKHVNASMLNDSYNVAYQPLSIEV